jgi:hypothetical protein
MMLLVSGAPTHYWQHPRVGILRTPRNGNSMATIVASGKPWACDNDCFQRLDRVAYLRMVRKVAAVDRARLLWVAAPDVVADAPATRTRFRLWAPVLHYYDLPVAFVAQDGQEALPVPWNDIACLFIGGSTRWKLGPHARRLIAEAKQHGKWVHVGRVNTLRRMWLFSSTGVDSIDGTAFSKLPDKFIPWMLRRLPAQQHVMEEILWGYDNAHSGWTK